LQAIFSGILLSAGGHTVFARYEGDANNQPTDGSAPSISVVVRPALTQISAEIVTPEPIVAGSTVTFIATVSAVPPSTGTPTGNVSFFVGGMPYQVLLDAGRATLTVPLLFSGQHSLHYSYYDLSNSYEQTNGPFIDFDVQPDGPAQTNLTLAVSRSPSNFGQLVTITAHLGVVHAPAKVQLSEPTGKVAFTIGDTTIQVTLADRQASYAVSLLPAGQHTIRAA
jgi:hypothetical protein